MHGFPHSYECPGRLYWAFLGIEIMTLLAFFVLPSIYLRSRSPRARFRMYPAVILAAVFLSALAYEPGFAKHLYPFKTWTTYWGDELLEWLHLASFASVPFAFSAPLLKWLRVRQGGGPGIAGRMFCAFRTMPGAKRAAILCAASSVFVVAAAFLYAWLHVKPVPLNGNLKHDAAVLVTRWIVEGRPLPSSSEQYPDAYFMKRMSRFYLSCDFLPQGETLSNDPRVVRVSMDKMRALCEEKGFGGNCYLGLSMGEHGADHISVGMGNIFAELAGHTYLFTFRREDGRLTVEVECTGVI
ncbi:MAG: hypothetical protein ACYS9X_05495 [Planctomycetota bacterium]|jgi:hypothetical protein